MPFGTSLVILLVLTTVGALSTSTTFVFSGLRPLLPFAWRMWLWGTIGLLAANALLIAILIPMLSGVAIVRGPAPSGDVRAALLRGLTILGPLVVSVVGVLLGTGLGFRLANRPSNNRWRGP